MVRAATSGMINFSDFDPWDMWWWKRLRWVLDELDLTHTREVCQAQHNHWITIASHSNLTDESFDKAKSNAGAAFNRLLKATYPWLADKIGEDGTKTEREEAVDSYHQQFGRPGDPQYEAMIDTLYNALKKGKLSQREKEKDRARRRAKREAAREAAVNGG